MEIGKRSSWTHTSSHSCCILTKKNKKKEGYQLKKEMLSSSAPTHATTHPKPHTQHRRQPRHAQHHFGHVFDKAPAKKILQAFTIAKILFYFLSIGSLYRVEHTRSRRVYRDPEGKASFHGLPLLHNVVS